ncbi:pseudouridylate synthase TRUB2, mitochondrial [Prorops nasuta]|uniref:pseudouridylate synthase TRUB2, mitochondrial n=1 Tax=Prorops nasuta TaxID=863751 RepID=UPI0034CD64EC
MSLQNLKTITSNAQIVWNVLNGIFVIYKPKSVHYLQVKDTILKKLCEDLNKMNVRPPGKYISIEGATNKQMDVVVRPSYADHPLVVGPRYQEADFRLLNINRIESNTSGVLVLGLNDGIKKGIQIKQARHPSIYRIKGVLGQATTNYLKTGKIIEKSTYKHVTRGSIDRLCAAMHTSHQQNMFKLCGLDIQSQAAYELAVEGPLRPANTEVPLLYAIQCIEFKSPEFSLEVVCINENENYLASLIHNIGIELRATATCSQIQCTKFGLFDLNLAMLKKHWNLQNIYNNMQQTEEIIKRNPNIIRPCKSVLTEVNK